jgi:glycosyltransferase involved in cell wall biosynthesis
MKKILFAVHRYAPYPGGSENNVKILAEECVRRGYDVTVLAGQHKGHLNNVKVTSDLNIIKQNFDLIIVHGGDVYIQNFVLSNAKNISSPILYLLILPSNSEVCLKALQDAKYIGCSTIEDWEHVKKHNVEYKSINFSYPIDIKISNGNLGFKKKYNITTEKMFISSGGFWHHKGMNELVSIFDKLPIKNTTLVLTGYQNKDLMPKITDNIKCFLLEDRQEVLNAIKEADLYILNSFQEGFGLVLLESMYNKTPWAARNIAGAKLMKDHGYVYNTPQELMKYILNFKKDDDKIKKAFDYVLETHASENAIKEILKILNN